MTGDVNLVTIGLQLGTQSVMDLGVHIAQVILVMASMTSNSTPRAKVVIASLLFIWDLGLVIFGNVRRLIDGNHPG